MRNLAKILLLLLFTAPITTADITSVKIRSDKRKAIHFKEFEFTQYGYVSLAISSVLVTTAVNSSLPQPDLSRIGFFLISEDNLFQFNQEGTKTPFERERLSCNLDSKFISTLFTFQDLSPPLGSSFNKSYAVTNPNWYSLRFANCNPLSYVSMDVRTELYNTDIDGNTKDYLSAGLTKLPSLYYNFSLIYPCLLGFWILTCFNNHQSFHWIHLLIGVLLVVKGLHLFCGAQVQHYLNVTGTRPDHGLDVLCYIFQFITAVLSYSVICMGVETKIVLIVVIPLRVLATICSVKGENSALYTHSVDWGAGLQYINCICCYVIIYHMWDAYHGKNNKAAARNYLAKFPLFSEFQHGCVAYLLIDFGLGIAVTFEYDWVSNLMNELNNLALYLGMLETFRTVEKNKDEELEV